ncbi:DUF1989 domain-containing protein [Anaerolineae bacterium CFX7]|nr:DUF1989 domain-containing protein [Anaerolineae bacterium CFX7]
MPTPLYEPKTASFLAVDENFYRRIADDTAPRKRVNEFVIPRRTGKAWTLRAGQVCRIVAVEGAQVGDLNLWNLRNPRERFWASRTRQLVGAHMRVLDRFWSTLPYLRPIATITADSIQYGYDADGAGCHDLLGTRCDPYVHKMLTGEELDCCCHSNLTRAIAPYRLTELDVHDVLNVFQVTGLTRERQQYFCKPCPAKRGDYFEFFAEIDLLCALSACPHGDMTLPIWGPHAVDPLEICRPLGVEVYDVDARLLQGWSEPRVAAYAGLHGFTIAP